MTKNKGKVKNLYSGFVLTFEPVRTQWTAEQLYPDAEISESFSAIDWEFERRELVLLVLDHDTLSISAMALMERKRWLHLSEQDFLFSKWNLCL